MSNIDSLLPEGKYWREFWDFKNTNSTTVPSSIRSGHALTLQNSAAKRYTCNGVHFTGAATSNINCGALYPSAGTLWVSFRFKLDQLHDDSSAIKYLWGKFNAAADKCVLYLNTNGRLYFNKRNVTDIVVVTVQDSWNAGQWYHVLSSWSAVNGMRIIVDSELLQQTSTQT